ncbi:hypothetical protein C8F04DRAFT_1184320 [Mycena alexandri]|uniref:Uncharacterized protein n=1 Tax=Mycena alexandri TaxID=1745969 RepID=A0AAD6X3C3_9AGAR|nr:hypothetical protein C8F04DRAFT_1184320 [Mycena alexandri]
MGPGVDSLGPYAAPNPATNNRTALSDEIFDRVQFWHSTRRRHRVSQHDYCPLYYLVIRRPASLQLLYLDAPGVTSCDGDAMFKGVEGKVNDWEEKMQNEMQPVRCELGLPPYGRSAGNRSKTYSDIGWRPAFSRMRPAAANMYPLELTQLDPTSKKSDQKGCCLFTPVGSRPGPTVIYSSPLIELQCLNRKRLGGSARIGPPPPRPREFGSRERETGRRAPSFLRGWVFAPSSRNSLSLTQFKVIDLNGRDVRHA